MGNWGDPTFESPIRRPPGHPHPISGPPVPTDIMRFGKLTIDRVENGQIITLGNGEKHVFSDASADRVLEFVRSWLAGLEMKS